MSDSHANAVEPVIAVIDGDIEIVAEFVNETLVLLTLTAGENLVSQSLMIVGQA